MFESVTLWVPMLDDPDTRFADADPATDEGRTMQSRWYPRDAFLGRCPERHLVSCPRGRPCTHVHRPAHEQSGQRRMCLPDGVRERRSDRNLRVGEHHTEHYV